MPPHSLHVMPPASFSHFPAIPPPRNVALVTLGEQPCPYLPGKVSQSRALWAERMPPAVYHGFMDAGFRRSGKLLYQPVCRACRSCIPIRVPVATFRPSKAQRRSRRRNEDLAVTISEPAATDEKFELYCRYMTVRHGHPPGEDEDKKRESFEHFLYDSPVETIEFAYRDAGGRLLAVGLCDVSGRSLSSVYFYFHPDEAKRGLGTFGAMYEIETAGRLGIPYYYLGYWVDGCGSMRYKADFQPSEILHPDGVWRPNHATVGDFVPALGTLPSK